MKRAYPILFFCVFVLFGAVWQVVALYLDQPQIRNFPPKGSHIIAIGDSLTTSVGASTSERGFITILEKRLGVTIDNKGVSGDTTRDALLRLKSDVLDQHPDIVMILLGGNDYLRHIPEEETFANLRTIIVTIQADGGVVLLLGIRGGLLADHFADNFENLAKETGSAYVPDVLSAIFGDPVLMSDQIHPNDRGYEKIADKVAPALMRLTPQTQTIVTE